MTTHDTRLLLSGPAWDFGMAVMRWHRAQAEARRRLLPADSRPIASRFNKKDHRAPRGRG